MSLILSTPIQSKSWRKGIVTTSLKDAATEASSPIRHSVELTTNIAKIVMSKMGCIVQI